MPVRFAAPLFLLLCPVGVVGLVWAMRQSAVELQPFRRRLIVALRMALVIVVGLAQARPTFVGHSTNVPTVILVDVSDSIGDRALEAARAFCRDVLSARGEQRVEVVTFAGHARQAPLGMNGPLIERHDGSDTHLAEAIDFARGLIPDAVPRIMLLTDGNDLHGSGPEAAHRVAAEGGEIDVIHLAAPMVDARVTALKLPDTLRQREKSRISAIVDTTTGGRATVALEEKGFLVGQKQVQLKSGSQSVDFDVTPTGKGPISYSARVSLVGDEVPGNNQFTQLAWVSGPPLVLLVANTPEESLDLEQSLTAQDVNVESMSPDSLPATLEGLLSYDEVILVGVAPSEIDRLRQSALVSYVRDTGGGLLFVSGSRGLRRDPEGKHHALEGILPLEMAAPNEKQEPPAAMVLLVDRSSSMVGEKLSYAKLAALAVIDRLTVHDQVGVVAFDASFEWIAPLAPLDDKERIKKLVENIGAGGGTRFRPALEEAYFQLRSAEAAVRHIILLTDGVSTDPNTFPELLSQARAGGITVSTVAIGTQADTKLLTEIATLGGGRYWMAANAAQVPNIFIKETETVQKDAANRSDTSVKVAHAARELAGIDFETAPPIKGYLRTKAKANTEVLLESPSHDPLLVRWRYGLGTVMAWTSDAGPAWSERWLTQRWVGYGKLWTQLVRGLQRVRVRHDLVLRLHEGDGVLGLDVEAVDAEGRFLNELEVDAVLEIEHEPRRVRLAQAGPGHYVGSIDMPVGNVLAYPVALRGGRRLDGEYVMLARPYGKELMHTGPDEAALDVLEKVGAGTRITTPAEALAKPVRPLTRPIPLSPWLLWLSLALFLGDVLVRRARWTVRR